MYNASLSVSFSFVQNDLTWKLRGADTRHIPAQRVLGLGGIEAGLQQSFILDLRKNARGMVIECMVVARVRNSGDGVETAIEVITASMSSNVAKVKGLGPGRSISCIG